MPPSDTDPELIDLESALHANEAIVPLIYEAAAGVREWDGVISEMIRFLDCDRGALSISYLMSGRGEVVASDGFDSDVLRAWESGFADNAWVQLASRLPAGRVLHDSRDKPVEDIRDVPIGRELIAPQGVTDGIGVKLTDSPLFVGVFSCYTTEDALGQESVDRLDFLVPHTARALSMHQRLTALHTQSRAFERSIDDLSAGVFFLHATGEIMHMNGMAEQIAASGDGLGIRDGKLDITHRPAKADLDAAVHQAVSADPNGSRRGLFQIPRKSSRRAYHAMLMPAFADLEDRADGALMLWVTDPEDPPVPNEDAIATLLDLTPAEARIARALAAGQSLIEYAHAVDITENTARSTLKQVFSKTSTRSQADLVRLILQSIPNPPF